ncbi:MAG: nucleoside-diphosphate kinase [Bacteroidales bacterium]|nr:nucleoside-diphosphate kinase [Bacteroidales bacterium]
MSGTKTLTIIKPGAVSHEHIGPILAKINTAGFHIAALKFFRLTRSQAQSFYSIHQEKSFFESLIDFMTSGPVVVAILEKEDAVAEYRKLIGATDPTKAEEGTIRKMFAESIERNAVHGSDSDENAEQECDFFFARSERYSMFEARLQKS